MNRSLFYVTCMALLSISAMSCGSTSTDVNVNANTARAGNTLGNAANTLGNAANTVANTVSNVASAVTGGTDHDFMEDAALGGMAEVELGKMAATKAANADIKKFAQMMVADHSKANEELKALAAKKNIKLPAELDSTRRAMMDDLRNRVGADFDRAYVEEMVEDHETDVKAFEDKANNAADPDIKAFAQKTVPVLRKHLDAIRAIQSKLQ